MLQIQPTSSSRKSSYTIDKSLIPVAVKNNHKEQQLHSDVIRALVEIFYYALKKSVSYDHINSVVPNSKIPLWHNGKKYDIALETKNAERVLIEVKVVKEWKTEKQSKQSQ